jgi:hypothetical protein
MLALLGPLGAAPSSAGGGPQPFYAFKCCLSQMYGNQMPATNLQFVCPPPAAQPQAHNSVWNEEASCFRHLVACVLRCELLAGVGVSCCVRVMRLSCQKYESCTWILKPKLTKMQASTGTQMGRAQYLVNEDEKQKYKLLTKSPPLFPPLNDRDAIQKEKHDLQHNGKYSVKMQALLDRYKDVK